jgi:hypothetical protein
MPQDRESINPSSPFAEMRRISQMLRRQSQLNKESLAILRAQLDLMRESSQNTSRYIEGLKEMEDILRNGLRTLGREDLLAEVDRKIASRRQQSTHTTTQHG